MRPFDIVERHLPRRAGKAEIQWSTYHTAERDGSVITLPIREDAMFVSLKRGTQFLYGEKSRHHDHLWFGGTDENPFLAELDVSMWSYVQAIPRDGESGFYHRLKPQRIFRIERALGVRAKRQGDIFAAKVGENWSTLRTFADMTGLTIEGDETKRCELRVFDTRHVLKGVWITAISYRKEQWGERVVSTARTLFATGVLEAPDHAPCELKGVHVLAQVEVLARPQSAD